MKDKNDEGFIIYIAHTIVYPNTVMILQPKERCEFLYTVAWSIQVIVYVLITCFF